MIKKGVVLILSRSLFLHCLLALTYIAPRECIASGTGYGIKFHKILIWVCLIVLCHYAMLIYTHYFITGDRH